MSNLRKFADQLKAPNWVVGGTVVAIILLLLSAVYAFSAGKDAAQSVQMISQSALVIAGLVGLPLAIWRSWTAHKQALTSQKQLEGFQKQISLLEAGAEAERLQKSTELLDSDKLTVRVAGVAILRNIAMSTTHTYRSEAFQVLKSHVKYLSTSDRKAFENDPLRKRTDLIYKSPDDVTTAFEVLVKLYDRFKDDVGSINLYGLHFHNLTLKQYSTQLATFHNCSFFYGTLEDTSGSTFVNCLFYNCVIEFSVFNHVEFKKCEFENCDLKGNLDISTVDTCSFKDCNIKNLHTNGVLKIEITQVPF